MTHLRLWRRGWLALAVSLFLGLAAYQLGLPGLHYDEAKEAGVNAMELLTGAPVSAFRDAAFPIAGRRLPLMVQDYIGALNVYLVLPFLATTGIGVPNLRALPILLAVVALLCLERAVSEWMALPRRAGRAPLAPAALYTLTLLVASPSFVFWNRQGIFVTNATLPFTFACLWQGLRWVRTAQVRSLYMAMLAAGLALYAKLSAAWIVGPFLLLLGGWWTWRQLRRPGTVDPEAIPVPTLSGMRVAGAVLALLAPLTPLFLFNLETGGTLKSIGANLTHSYYGVDNADLAANLGIRLGQLAQTLQGNHFWYLGGLHGNPLAPWIGAAVVVGAMLTRQRRLVLLPFLLLGAGILASLFTVSALFITHYALIHPLAVAVVGIGLEVLCPEKKNGTRISRHPGGTRRIFTDQKLRIPRKDGTQIAQMHTDSTRRSPGRRWRMGDGRHRLLFLGLLLLIWLLFDLSATLGYHRDLARSGGLADHSDASYHLAFYLRYNGLGAPIALDWGMDAPIRYLSQGTVTPVEIFGYARLDRPDDGLALRLGPFLDNPDNVYLLHAPGHEVFAGRRRVLEELVQLRGRRLVLVKSFPQRDGAPLYELWRVE